MVETQNHWADQYKIPEGSKQNFETSRHIAFSIWESAGRPWGTALDFWLAAQNVAQTAIDASARTAWGHDISGSLQTLFWKAFPAKAYLDLAYKLAHEMWQHADQHYRAQLDIWLAAEKTILAVVSGVVSTASSAYELPAALTNAFERFSPQAYLERVRQAAYYKWIERGRPTYWNSLDPLKDWLEAEEEVRHQVAGESLPGDPIIPPKK